MASSLHDLQLLAQRKVSCDKKLIVLCIEKYTNVPRRRKREAVYVNESSNGDDEALFVLKESSVPKRNKRDDILNQSAAQSGDEELVIEENTVSPQQRKMSLDLQSYPDQGAATANVPEPPVFEDTTVSMRRKREENSRRPYRESEVTAEERLDMENTLWEEEGLQFSMNQMGDQDSDGDRVNRRHSVRQTGTLDETALEYEIPGTVETPLTSSSEAEDVNDHLLGYLTQGNNIHATTSKAARVTHTPHIIVNKNSDRNTYENVIPPMSSSSSGKQQQDYTSNLINDILMI